MMVCLGQIHELSLPSGGNMTQSQKYVKVGGKPVKKKMLQNYSKNMIANMAVMRKTLMSRTRLMSSSYRVYPKSSCIFTERQRPLASQLQTF
jgi:hypothetical protein